MSVIQALAMTVAEIPVFLYTTFGQVKVGAGGLWSCLYPSGLQNTEALISGSLAFGKASPSLLLLPQVSGVSCFSTARRTRLGVWSPKPALHPRAV